MKTVELRSTFEEIRRLAPLQPFGSPRSEALAVAGCLEYALGEGNINWAHDYLQRLREGADPANDP